MKSSRIIARMTALTAAMAMAGFAGAAQKLTADIVVVGAGSAGLSAAVQAAEKGKKVVLLEKNPFVGGCSAFAEGLYGVESEWQRLASIPLTRDQEYLDQMHKQFYVVDPFKNRDFIEGSAENLDWLAKHDIKFQLIHESMRKLPTWHVIGEYKGGNHGAALVKALKDHADKLGVDTRLATPATSLIKNKKGEIIGVKAKGRDGEITITSKAVILASGGFGDDPEKVRDWLHRDPKAIGPSVPIGKTGDGIKMALAAGADMGNVSFIGHTHAHGHGLKFLSNLYTTSWQPATMWVNSDGNRCADESVTFCFIDSANIIYEQFGHHVWSIFDEGQVKYMMEKGIDSGIGVLVPVGAKLKDLKKDIDEALAANSDVFKAAGSVEELARKIGVPADALKASLEKYNRACDNQHDGEFHKNRTYLRKLDPTKLYAIQLSAGFFSTWGGLRTNRMHEVLDTHNKPIPGLYAAGLEVSDMVGPTYSGWTSGYAFGFASYSGRHAALNAAKKIDGGKK
jgi:fumarate reductase flavoprotein subunit